MDMSLLSANSQNKFQQLHFGINKSFDLNQKIKNLIENMKKAFRTELNVKLLPPINLNLIRKTFIDFDKSINGINGSKFQNDIMNMNKVFSLIIKIFNDNITLNFLINDIFSVNFIASVIHALHTF